MTDESTAPDDPRIAELTPQPTVAVWTQQLMSELNLSELWLHEQGHHEGPGPWESYIDDPREETDISQLRTEVIWPLG